MEEAQTKNRNCWLVNLIPFNPNEKKIAEKVKTLQAECVNRKIFGMGWNSERFVFKNQEPLNANTKSEFINKIDQSLKTTAMKKAIDSFGKIQLGDIVVMRLRDAHFYLGEVQKPPYYLCSAEEDLKNISWVCEVKEWHRFENDEELPAYLCAQFTYRNQSTVRPADEQLKKMIELSLRRAKGEVLSEEEKVPLSEDNFFLSLYYMDLEDVAAAYIYERHGKDGYLLLPSSCKFSKPKFECTFVKKDAKPITCQVKNKGKLKTEDYFDESSYERIYLFNGAWDGQTVEQEQERCKGKNIQIITRKELYETLIAEQTYLHKKLRTYYSF